ncbi:MAG: hypothetical protein IJE81_03905 [Oscillospiraceae bacterium]|nr:hypothetical protein [Oscillospiraceae bacterium]MBQ7129529.1 hypothetical protein [Oscillospiraceae bacterium]
MKTGKEILSSVLKTTQMGQVGIRSVLDASVRPGLRAALEDQLKEYDSIETEAHTIAGQRGWELRELEPAARFLADRWSRMKLNRGDCDSRIADMMIQGNTKGMVKGLRNLHQYPNGDDRIATISQKLIDCETANIRQMRQFL